MSHVAWLIEKISTNRQKLDELYLVHLGGFLKYPTCPYNTPYQPKECHLGANQKYFSFQTWLVIYDMCLCNIKICLKNNKNTRKNCYEKNLIFSEHDGKY